jgi:hypothetical protein
MEDNCLSNHGEHHRVQPIPGYTHNLIPKLRLCPEMASRGLYTARFETSTDVQVVVNTALAPKPAGGASYVRLLSVEWKIHGQSMPQWGMALEGDPFSSYVKPGLGMIIRNLKPDELPYCEKSAKILKVVNYSLGLFGATSGNEANLSQMARFYQQDMLTPVVKAVLNEELTEHFLKSLDPNSIESVPDLNYEVGLGIVQDTRADEAIGHSSPLPAIGGSSTDDTTSKVQDLELEILKDLMGWDLLTVAKAFGSEDYLRNFILHLPRAVKATSIRTGDSFYGSAFIGPPYDDPDSILDRKGCMFFQPGGPPFERKGPDIGTDTKFRSTGVLFRSPVFHMHMEVSLKPVRFKVPRPPLGGCGNPSDIGMDVQPG